MGQASSPTLLKPAPASALPSVGAPPPPRKAPCSRKHVRAWLFGEEASPVGEGRSQLGMWGLEEEAEVTLGPSIRCLVVNREHHPCSPAGTPSGPRGRGPTLQVSPVSLIPGVPLAHRRNLSTPGRPASGAPPSRSPSKDLAEAAESLGSGGVPSPLSS